MSKVQGATNQNLVWTCEYIKTRIKTAYHEAGHAVIALIYGCDLIRVQVFDCGSGQTEIGEKSAPCDPMPYVFVAGIVAERLFSGSDEGGQQDRIDFNKYGYVNFNSFQSEVTKKLKKDWSLVTKIALILERDGLLRFPPYYNWRSGRKELPTFRRIMTRR